MKCPDCDAPLLLPAATIPTSEVPNAWGSSRTLLVPDESSSKTSSARGKIALQDGRQIKRGFMIGIGIFALTVGFALSQLSWQSDSPHAWKGLLGSLFIALGGVAAVYWGASGDTD